jgi:hypothetical protein
MPRLKIDDEELDDSLDDVEYSENDFARYDGEQPPVDTWLRGYVKAMWWTYTKNEDPMLKVLWVADGNEGETEEYNGLPVWENMALTASAKFKWGPFFRHFGLTIKYLKTKLVIAEDDDPTMGAPITKIGTLLAPGEDSANARCAIITTREKYNNGWQPHVKEWLDDEEPEDEEDSEEEEEELEEEEDEEESEEEEPPPPARTRRTASGKSSAQPATKPASSSRTAATKTSGAKTSAAAKKPAAKTSAKPASARGKRAGRASGGFDEEPPF